MILFPMIRGNKILGSLVQIEKMPDGVPLIYDRDWIIEPDGELFLPSVDNKCERCDGYGTISIRLTKLYRVEQCPYCEGAGWRTP